MTQSLPFDTFMGRPVIGLAENVLTSITRIYFHGGKYADFSTFFMDDYINFERDVGKVIDEESDSVDGEYYRGVDSALLGVCDKYIFFTDENCILKKRVEATSLPARSKLYTLKRQIELTNWYGKRNETIIRTKDKAIYAYVDEEPKRVEFPSLRKSLVPLPIKKVEPKKEKPKKAEVLEEDSAEEEIPVEDSADNTLAKAMGFLEEYITKKVVEHLNDSPEEFPPELLLFNNIHSVLKIQQERIEELQEALSNAIWIVDDEVEDAT